jgi:hypothetical protein
MLDTQTMHSVEEGTLVRVRSADMIGSHGSRTVAHDILQEAEEVLAFGQASKSVPGAVADAMLVLPEGTSPASVDFGDNLVDLAVTDITSPIGLTDADVAAQTLHGRARLGGPGFTTTSTPNAIGESSTSHAMDWKDRTTTVGAIEMSTFRTYIPATRAEMDRLQAFEEAIGRDEIPPVPSRPRGAGLDGMDGLEGYEAFLAGEKAWPDEVFRSYMQRQLKKPIDALGATDVQTLKAMADNWRGNIKDTQWQLDQWAKPDHGNFAYHHDMERMVAMWKESIAREEQGISRIQDLLEDIEYTEKYGRSS